MKNNTWIFIGLVVLLAIIGFTCYQKSKKEKMMYAQHTSDNLVVAAEQAPIRLYNISPDEAPTQVSNYELIDGHRNTFGFGAGASGNTQSEWTYL